MRRIGGNDLQGNVYEGIPLKKMYLNMSFSSLKGNMYVSLVILKALIEVNIYHSRVDCGDSLRKA